jgi:hypothetical protein
MPYPGHHPAGKQTAQQQPAEIGGDDEAHQGRGKAFDLCAHPEQRRKQAVGEQQ